MPSPNAKSLARPMFASLAKVCLLVGVAAAVLLVLLPRLRGEYGEFPVLVDGRTAIWVVMELHLMLAAFVLGVPLFAMIVEIVGAATKDERYDRLAWEFTRLLALAFTATAVAGVLALLLLVVLYPSFTKYLTKIFSPTFLPYAACIVADAALLVVYYYGWERMKGRLKWLHIGIVALLNLIGTAMMCIANAWATFMMSPAGVNEQTGALVSLSEAIQNPLWWPINVHRMIANVAFGGAVAGAYAAIRFLTARTEEDRAHYDWMGYVGNFVAMCALIPLPFAGYWLGKEIYAYSAGMGTTLMGGAFSWLFIIQAVLIGAIFISANYYFWLGLGRIPGGGRYMKYVLALEVLLFLCLAVWMTPHTLVATLAEARKMGGAHHPLLGVFGVMSAKNTAVNIVILTTFVSFLLYRRANLKREGARPAGGVAGPVVVLVLSLFPILFCAAQGWLSAGARAERRLPALEASLAERTATVLADASPVKQALDELKGVARAQSEVEELRTTPGIHHAASYRVLAVLFAAFAAAGLADMLLLRGRVGGFLQWVILAMAAGIVVYFGVKGYFVEAEVRIGYSLYQVMAVLFAILSVAAIDLFIWFGAQSLGRIEWGKMPVRSQYTLCLLAVTFTLLMGLMGFVRAAIREAWHVYGVVRDTSATSYTPTMGYGTLVIAVTTLIFFGILFAVFRFGMKEKANVS